MLPRKKTVVFHIQYDVNKLLQCLVYKLACVRWSVQSLECCSLSLISLSLYHDQLIVLWLTDGVTVLGRGGWGGGHGVLMM